MRKLIAFRDWVDARLPIMRAWNTHMARYYAPKNFNFWYFFGVLSLLVLAIQLLSGIWLLMSYTATAQDAFASVEYIMRDVDYGWLIRYMHSTGASAFFIVVYLHVFRGLLYGSYRKPRELVWIVGMVIYLMLMTESFIGYVLPWGQMSFWGTQVITNLFGSIPFVGETLSQWIRGDYLVSDITLNRFLSMHAVLVPLLLLGMVVVHILALHQVGSSSPDGVEIKQNKDEHGIPRDGIPFHPYYTVHDLMPVVIFLMLFCSVIFFAPEMGGFFLEHANFEEANQLKTPEHIAPLWYFTPFYSMLRAVPSTIFGVAVPGSTLLGFILMMGAPLIFIALPWLDRSPVRSIRYKGTFSRVAVLVFAAACLILGALGMKPPTEGRTWLARICTIIYFAYFLAMPFWTRREKVKPVPERVTTHGGLGGLKTLGVFLLVALIAWLPLKVVGAESNKCGNLLHCDAMELDPGNQKSLQNGLRLFTNYCWGCHSLKYVRFERVADDLDIPHAIMLQNTVFDDRRIGDMMSIAMPEDKAEKWFGTKPMDLTLNARARSPQWIYTYLRNFYADSSRPTGVNNRVFPNVGMPHVLLELQGLQSCAPGPTQGRSERDHATGEPIMNDPCGRFVLAKPGSMTPEEFDDAVYDLVNFLGYVAEPVAGERRELGVYVLMFLALLLICVWLLNREYWKDIH